LIRPEQPAEPLLSICLQPDFGYCVEHGLESLFLVIRTGALVDLLAGELSSSDPSIARGIAYRAAGVILERNTDDWRGSMYTAVACRLLANAGTEKVKLEQQLKDGLSPSLRDQKTECEPAKPAAPH
jgi:hypothetical protein